MCVASRAEVCCWSGGGERWGAAWWDDEQHLSPINSLYLSPHLLQSRNPSPLPHHMVASSFAVWALFHENSLLPTSSPFHLFFRWGRASAGATILKASPFVAGLASLCRRNSLFVSNFSALTWFWNCSIIHFPMPVGKLVDVSCHGPFGFVK